MLRCIVQTNDKVLTFEHCTNYKISDRVFDKTRDEFWAPSSIYTSW